jgi:hypothetical protein
MKRKFMDKTFSERDTALIEACNAVLDAYAVQGYDLSLRQLFYQLVSHNIIPNTNASYELLGRIVSDARMAGLIDWDMITDRGRVTQQVRAWSSPGKMLKELVLSYRYKMWKNQKVYIEVMVEKQALEGVIAPVCAQLGVNYTSNKGYSSQSAMYEASLRLNKAIERGKTPVVLYGGDHDPSGLDMTEDIRRRLELFCGRPIDVKRLMLNKSQIEEYRLPPNPVKVTDSRAGKYSAKHGEHSWEMDALPPNVLAGLIKAAVMRRVDKAQWDKDAHAESVHRAQLNGVSNFLDDIYKKTKKNTPPKDLE